MNPFEKLALWNPCQMKMNITRNPALSMDSQEAAINIQSPELICFNT